MRGVSHACIDSLSDDKLDDDELAEFELLAERMVQAVFKLRAVLRKMHAEDLTYV